VKDKSLEEVRAALVTEALAMGKLAKAITDEKGKTLYVWSGGQAGTLIDINSFDRDTLFPVVLSVAQKLTTTPKKPKQRVIDVDELQKYIDEGWSFRSSINGHSARSRGPRFLTSRQRSVLSLPTFFLNVFVQHLHEFLYSIVFHVVV